MEHTFYMYIVCGHKSRIKLIRKETCIQVPWGFTILTLHAFATAQIKPSITISLFSVNIGPNLSCILVLCVCLSELYNSFHLNSHAVSACRQSLLLSGCPP